MAYKFGFGDTAVDILQRSLDREHQKEIEQARLAQQESQYKRSLELDTRRVGQDDTRIANQASQFTTGLTSEEQRYYAGLGQAKELTLGGRTHELAMQENLFGFQGQESGLERALRLTMQGNDITSREGMQVKDLLSAENREKWGITSRELMQGIDIKQREHERTSGLTVDQFDRPAWNNDFTMPWKDTGYDEDMLPAEIKPNFNSKLGGKSPGPFGLFGPIRSIFGNESDVKAREAMREYMKKRGGYRLPMDRVPFQGWNSGRGTTGDLNLIRQYGFTLREGR